MSDYKKMMGYNKKKKIDVKESKPKVNKVLNSIKKEFGNLNESVTWDNRKFGERLPTMEDYQEAYDKKNNCIIECSKKYLRPAEVDTLKGNFSKARKILKWKPEHDLKSLIKDMISYELKSIF